MSKSKKIIISLELIFLLGVGAVLFAIFLQMPKPCQKPLTYRLGRIDEKFGLSRPEFSMAVKKAAAVWGKPLSRELFREDSQGTIEIRFIYDYRQETSDKLKQLKQRMADTKNIRESMKVRYESLKYEYEQKYITLENDLRDYNARINAYNAEIEYWNREGGAPERERRRLMLAKNELNSARESLQVRQNEVKRLVDEINSMLLVINENVSRQNLDVDHYRDVGSRLSGEFQEGFFESKDGRQSITIYHLENEAKLVRLLVHELGHALRLNHSDNPDAVMYRLNRFDIAELTEDDIAALKGRCEGK